MAAFELRTATGDDARLLSDMIVAAANWQGSKARERISVLEDPLHRRYLAGWKRPGDAGLVALDGQKSPIGACWFRLFPSDDHGFGFIAVGVPELILGVQPIWRAQGLGRALLLGVIAQARAKGHARLSLSVETGNHAVQLYRSEGFQTVSDFGDRQTMVRALR